MRTIETRRGSGSHWWRVLMAHVLAFALIISSVSVHVDAADIGFSTAALSVTNDAGSATEGAASPLGHGLVVHATCGCHIGVREIPIVAVRLPVPVAMSLPLQADARARPGPAALPFEPPRA